MMIPQNLLCVDVKSSNLLFTGEFIIKHLVVNIVYQQIKLKILYTWNFFRAWPHQVVLGQDSGLELAGRKLLAG